jgi:hypothetical protein
VRGGAGGHELGHGGAGGGKVEVAEGVGAGGEGEACAKGGGEGVRLRGVLRGRREALLGGSGRWWQGGFFRFGEVAEDGPHDAAEPAGGELGAPGSGAAEGFVDGDDAAHLEHDELGVFAGGLRVWEDLEGGLDHLEARRAGGCVERVAGARAFELAVEGDGLAGLELVFEVSAVEPHALYGFADVLRGRRGASRGEGLGGRWGGEKALHSGVGGGVGGSDAYGHFEDGAGAGAEEDGAADFADEGGHVSGVVEGEGLGVEAVFVAEGEVVEEVFDGVDTAFGEIGGDAFADALDELDGRGEFERHGVDGSSGGVALCIRYAWQRNGWGSAAMK